MQTFTYKQIAKVAKGADILPCGGRPGDTRYMIKNDYGQAFVTASQLDRLIYASNFFSECLGGISDIYKGQEGKLLLSYSGECAKTKSIWTLTVVIVAANKLHFSYTRCKR
jgi:hypothetical protein